MNKHNKTATDSQIQRTNKWSPEGTRVGGGMKKVKKIKRFKLPDIK